VLHFRPNLDRKSGIESTQIVRTPLVQKCLKRIFLMSDILPCKEGKRIAIISDTHGSLPSKAVQILKKADLIIHAGDFDSPDVFKTLREMGSVVAVRGNMDGGPWTMQLPQTDVVEIEGIMIYILHNLDRLDLDPATAGFDVVVSGHTHRPRIKKKQGVLFVNPGSLGWPRSNHPPSMALLCVKGKSITTKLVALQ
jgi:putative phosphoesterase